MTNSPQLPLTKFLLVTLDAAGGAVADYWNFFYNLHRYHGSFLRGGHGYVAEIKRFQNKSYAQQTLDALRRRKFVRTRRLGNKLIVELTDTGRRQILELTLQKAPKLTPGNYTLVTFDIPEEVRLARRQFRWFLRHAGFTKLQQSVWISPRDTLEPLARFVRQLKIERWVVMCYASHFTKLPKID